ncbi:hypothetical protein [Cytobacillus solani]|uniref:Uncharacterized protein n=1 Tax=Cytobacillus solani TaxID=1637975 RepID=A0A0Q3T3S5_9BACI|nr:hypothetical protein [Cytobacillus solani]KQL18077.1 hypothetical protein AN957_05250 [Cytobacillus solani]
MILVKIKNLVQQDGSCDYKGLDISLIKTGTQLYPLNESVAYFGYEGDIPTHTDISVITQEDYQIALDQIKQEAENIMTPEKEIAQLKEKVDAQQSVINYLLGV